MECISSPIEPEVMPEFIGASTCTTAFFRVASRLEQLNGKEAVQKHTLLSTGQGHLLEIVAGKVHRFAPCAKDVTKIVVHHDFEPLQLYVVLLCGSGIAVLLAYQDLKILHKWEEVRDIASADPKATGTPQLLLTMQDEQAAVISNDKLMSYAYDGSKKREDKEEEEKKAAVGEDVFDALMFHFKGGMKHAERLKAERKRNENFIAAETVSLQSRLRGELHEKERTLMPTLTEEEGEAKSKENVPTPSPNPLKVQRVHHKLIHDKWVVGVNVANEGERVLVTDLELNLHCKEMPLCHTTLVLKTVRHSRPGNTDVRVTIDHLDPPVLRPKKKVTVVGVCDIPSFERGPSLSCCGLLSYTCKPILMPSSQPVNTNVYQSLKCQVPIPVVKLHANELHNHQASVELCDSPKTAFVTFSTLALVAASKCTRVSLTSLVSPLTNFIDIISHHHKLNKMHVVSDFYVLHPRESHPLQQTGFILHPVNSHHLKLTLYTKDAKQAYVLAHTLLATLPEDASIQFLCGPKDTGSTAIQPHSLYHMLMAKMREAATHITDGLEAQLTTNKAPRTEREESEEQEEDNITKDTEEREEPENFSDDTEGSEKQEEDFNEETEEREELEDVFINDTKKGSEEQEEYFTKGTKKRSEKQKYPTKNTKGREELEYNFNKDTKDRSVEQEYFFTKDTKAGSEKQKDNFTKDTEERKTQKKDFTEYTEEQKKGYAEYAKEREELLARKGNITFKGEEYSVWREKLQDIQSEVDSLYLQFLKVSCITD